MLWTSKEAEKATGGKSTIDWQATGMSIDTRSLREGELFIALHGKNGDGHDYVCSALANGAAAAIVSHIPEGLDEGAPLLVVDDTLVALQDIGQAARFRTGAKIIAVTGSVGKTGTKEMLGRAFSVLGQTHASRASFNNHWGVPLSLSAMDAGTDFGVFEIGMNHPGEITPLTRQVKPDIAIITTIASVHMEHFEDVYEIADSKAEIFDGMDHNGIAILNRDNEFYAHLKAKAETKGLKVIGFGEHEEADARLTECLLAANGSRAKAKILDDEVSFSLQASGKHNVMNALAVLLAVKTVGEDVAKAAKALSTMEAVAGRGKRELLDIGEADNPVTLLDESYNASPVAMSAAFKVLAMIDPGRGGRRIAFLGDMYELGRNAAQIHADLALPLQAADVRLVYTSGPLMKNLYNALPEERRGGHKDDSSELAEIVPDVLAPGDVIMVKGSRGPGEKPRMQVVVEALRALPGKLRGKTKRT